MSLPMPMLPMLPCLLALAEPSPGTVQLDESPRRRPPVRTIAHLGTGLTLAEATEHDSGDVAPGVATQLDLGVQRDWWLWTGAVVDWGAYPSKDMSAHQVTGGLFYGIRPQVGPLWFPIRLGAAAGAVIGRSPEEYAWRPVAIGQLRLGLEGPGATFDNIRWGFYLALDLNSRATSFLTTTGDGVGLGRLRGGAMFNVAWDVPLGSG